MRMLKMTYLTKKCNRNHADILLFKWTKDHKKLKCVYKTLLNIPKVYKLVFGRNNPYL